jgi:subtilase family protein
MPTGKPRRRRAVTCSLAALGFACLAVPAPAAAAGRPRSGDLSPRLAELAKRSVRSVSPAKQAKELDLAATGPGSLLREGNRVVVEVRFDRGAASGVDDLRAAGTKIVDVSRRYQTVTVAARPSELKALSAAPGVRAATEVLVPIVYATGPGPVAAAVTPCFGAATSEGDVQLRAAQARAEFEVDGSGVTVGVLSDSYDQDAAAPTVAAEDVVSGDLPGPANPCERESPVVVLDDSETKGEDEGRAMAQIVHDLAPGAELAFATAFKKTMLGFADNIRKLAEPVGSGGAEADVIVDDVLYLEEPFFQEGPVGVAVGEVSEAGVDYFSAAGNNNLRNGGLDIASWEAPEFRDASPVACPPKLPGYAEHCMDFDPGEGVDTTFGVTVEGEETLSVDLQWAQPWEGVTTDLDAYLLGPEGEILAEAEDFNVKSTQRPFEFLSWTNPSAAARTVRIAIDRCGPTCDSVNGGDEGSPRLKVALLQNGGGVTATEYQSSSSEDVVGPTIFGHNGAEDAVSLGAIRYTTNAAPEVFSSRGPVTNYFAPAEGATPAPPLGEPQVLVKPDVVATDGGANTFFGSCFADAWRFFGTSASAPHAAAIAALQREAKFAATPAEISQAQRDSAAAVGSFPATAVGAGMLDAVGAIEALGISPAAPGAPVESAPSPVPCVEEPEPEPKEEPKPIQPVVPPPGPEPPVEGRAPSTFFRRHPPKVVQAAGRSAIVVFRFGSNEAGVSFLCKIDRRGFRACPRRLSRGFALGAHVLRVKARDQDGEVDQTPAVFRFRVMRIAGD